MSRIFNLLAGLLLFAASSLFAAKPVVTVLPLSGEKINGEEIRSFDNHFQDALFQTGALEIIERGRLNKVLAQQALKDSGITEEKAQSVALKLGVEMYIIGDMRKTGDQYQITVRAVTAESSNVKATASASGASVANFQKIADELSRTLVAQLAGKVEKSDETINRKVLVLDFVNQNKMEAADYLSVSIAEALIDPLDKTGNFQTLNRDSAQETAKNLKIDKEKFFNEGNATEIGKSGGAEVVVIGSFVAIGNKIQIQVKAVDVLSGRVKVSKSATGKLDATIFDTITQLSEGMAQKMKAELPPISKREVIHLSGDRATYGGMLWRSAILPGWGHVYGNQKRGYLYMGLWVGTAGTFLWSHFNYTTAQNTYMTAKSDFDAKYATYSSAMDLRAYMSYAFLGVTAFVWADALFFGRGIGAPPASLSQSSEQNHGLQIGSFRRFEAGAMDEYTYMRYGYTF